MTQDTRTREQVLLDVLQIRLNDLPRQLDWYINRYDKVNRDSILSGISRFHTYCGLKSYFIDYDISSMKQHFFVACKLMQASQIECDQVTSDNFSTYTPFLYGLLSDSPEIIEWLSHAELRNKGDVKLPHFRFYQFQLLLRGDESTLYETIKRAANKGGKQDRKEFSTGTDFFSMVLRNDKEGLRRYIENKAKIKTADPYFDEFISGYAVTLTKLCWIKGVEVEINHPGVPMALMPVAPLDRYEIEYDFLLPGWTPPKLGVLDKIKRLMKKEN